MRKLIDITLDKFKKLNLIGYKRERIKISDNTHRLGWKKVKLNDELNNYELEKGKFLIIAIHNDSNKALEYEKIWNKKFKEKTIIVDGLPCDFYYFDKWLNHFGATTYLIGVTEKLYTNNPKKWYIRDDYFDIYKNETEIIYRIKI